MADEVERFVNMAPMLLRFRMSRLTRTTEKLVDSVSDTGSSAVWMFITPMAYLPTFPVNRPPPLIGITRPRLSPMRRL